MDAGACVDSDWVHVASADDGCTSMDGDWMGVSERVRSDCVGDGCECEWCSVSTHSLALRFFTRPH